MSKYSRWATCLFFIRSSISSLSFKIFCWFFFICKLKGLYLIIFFFRWLVDGVPCLCLWAAAKFVRISHYSSIFWSMLPLAVDLKILSHTCPHHWCNSHLFSNPWANPWSYPPRGTCSVATYERNFYNPKGLQKWCVITSIYSPNQVFEYPQKYPLILYVQKLYQAHLENNTGHDCLVLVQFDLFNRYFYSK